VLVAENGEGCLIIFVSPLRATIVAAEDQPYIDDLLSDFIERAAIDPIALFQQISNLSVGPLITHKIGSFDSDASYIQAFCSDFVSL
jgi:hypothetical protein